MPGPDPAQLLVISLAELANDRASVLATRLGVAFRAYETSGRGHTIPERLVFTHEFELQVDVDTTVLQPRLYKSGPVGIEFGSGRNHHRLLHGGGRGQTLIKALGIKRSLNRQQINNLHVLDATSGFCRDSWAIAAVGCRVTALERCTWLHWMQVEALLRASEGGQDSPVQQTCKRIKPVNSDAIAWLRQVSKAKASLDIESGIESAVDEVSEPDKVDVIYIDPMYPERKKSAAVKKEMQALHRLLGADLDSEQLLESACSAAPRLATRRIVVKRPGWANPLCGFAGWRPTSSHSSENTRYDVYLGPAAAES